jgi:hypothetical protein
MANKKRNSANIPSDRSIYEEMAEELDELAMVPTDVLAAWVTDRSPPPVGDDVRRSAGVDRRGRAGPGTGDPDVWSRRRRFRLEASPTGRSSDERS